MSALEAAIENLTAELTALTVKLACGKQVGDGSVTPIGKTPTLARLSQLPLTRRRRRTL